MGEGTSRVNGKGASAPEQRAPRDIERDIEHLRTRTDVQNIDMMNLAGFCRNCLSNWM